MTDHHIIIISSMITPHNLPLNDVSTWQTLHTTVLTPLSSGQEGMKTMEDWKIGCTMFFAWLILLVLFFLNGAQGFSLRAHKAICPASLSRTRTSSLSLPFRREVRFKVSSHNVNCKEWGEVPCMSHVPQSLPPWLWACIIGALMRAYSILKEIDHCCKINVSFFRRTGLFK